MALRHRLHRYRYQVQTALGLTPPVTELGTFAFKPHEVQSLKDNVQGEMQAAFFAGGRRGITKWHHYLDVYDRHLASYRNQTFFLLEIGVCEGGSLEMWRRYFGPKATIVGIDIDPASASKVDPENHVRIGSQDNPVFLRQVIAEFGTPDVILDDGSHFADHQRASFEVLFPLLKDGGIYMIEDVHTAYWPRYAGGYKYKHSVIELTKRIIDDMHAWYHNRPTITPARDEIAGVHVYDSIIAFDKKRKRRPGYLGNDTV
jgi:hypothetical protein